MGARARWLTCRIGWGPDASGSGASPHVTVAMTTYLSLVAALIIGVFLTPDQVAAILYVTAVVLTLPTGVFIYPGLWLNSLAVGSSGLDDRYASPLFTVGVVSLFLAAAAGNAYLARAVYRAVTQRR